jgi:cytochrome c peroxidase
MLGKPISAEETTAMLSFLQELEPPPNPFRDRDGLLTEAAQRGKVIFESAQAGCATCHSGPHFTDGKIHDVGLGSDDDVYQGFNTPSLRGVHRKVRLLHNGRGKSLEQILTNQHAAEKVAGEGSLSDSQLQDLIAYLKSL